MDRTIQPQPDGALSIALELVAEAVDIGTASGPVGLDFHGAWATVRAAALASVTPAAAPAKPTTLEAEARGALERYAGAIAGLEPSVDSAMGIGVAAAGALVHLAALGVAALDRIGDHAADVSDHLRSIARTLSSANIEGWGGR